MEIADDAISDVLEDMHRRNAFGDIEDSTESVTSTNIIETAATALRRCSLLLEKSLLSEEDEENDTETKKKMITVRSDISQAFDELMQSYRDRLEILTSVDRFLFRARKLVDINKSTTISEDNFLLINESFKLMRSIRNKMRNNSENIAKIGFHLLEKLHARIPVAQSSSKRSLTRPEEDKALDVVVYEEKLLATHLPTWLKAVGMIKGLLEKSEKLTPYLALQKVLTLGKDLLQNMSKAVKTCFDNKNKSEVINKKIEKQIELSKLYDKEMTIQQEELDDVTIQIAELRESQKKLEENIQYHQEVEKLLRRDSVTEEEKMKAMELIKQPDEAEPLRAETDESKAEKGPQEVLTLCERKLQLQKASANVLRHNVQKMEAIACELEILKEERMRKKQERIQFLEILEQPEKQEHPELTSSEQEQGDASAVSSFTQDSSTTEEVPSRQTTVSSSESQPRGDKEPSSPDSIQRSTSSRSSIRSAELETTEKTQAQLVLMTILNQLKEMKEFFVRMLASKEMVELAKQLDSLGCCETDADGVQTIKLSSPDFRNVLDHIQTILSKVLRSSKVSRLASKKTVAGNVINLTGSTAANEKRKELEVGFADLFRKYRDLWFMYFQLRGRLKNEYQRRQSSYKARPLQSIRTIRSMPNLQVMDVKHEKPTQTIRRKQKLIMDRRKTSPTPANLRARGKSIHKPIEKFSDLKMDLPTSWKEDLQNIQEAFAKGEIDRETYMEALVLMLKLAAVLQQKQALLGEGFLMDRLKQSLTAKIQKILEAVTSKDYPLYLLMKDADYDNYTAFLQQMNEEDRKIRLEQEKLLLFMKLEELYEKIRDRACRRKSRVNTIELVAKETQKKLAQLRVTQSLASYRPAPARLEDQTPTFFSFSQSGIPKVIRSLTKIQRQTILEEAEEVQDLVSETLASDYSGTISEGKFSQQQKFDQKKLTKEEFTGASSPVLDIASQEATLPHLQKKPKKLEKPCSYAEMISTKHSVLSKHHKFSLPLQRPLTPFNSLVLTLPPMSTLPTEKGPCPKKVKTVRYSISSKALTSVPSHTSHVPRRKEEYVFPRLDSSKRPTFPQIRLKHKQLDKVHEEILRDLLAPSLSSSQERPSGACSPELSPRFPQKQALASYLDQTQEYTEYLQNEEHAFSLLKQEPLGKHRNSPAGSESEILPEEEKQEVFLPLSVDEQFIFALDQPPRITRSKRSMFPKIIPDPVTQYQIIRHLLLHKKILSEIHLHRKQPKDHKEKLSKRLPCASTLHNVVLGHEISPKLASKSPQMLLQICIKDVSMQIMNKAILQRLPQHKASSQQLILNVKKWIHQLEEKLEERRNGKPATLPALPTDLICFLKESESDLALSSLDSEHSLKPDLTENEGASLSLDIENKLESVSPKYDEAIKWSKRRQFRALSEDLDDTSDLSDSPSGEMADFCMEVPLLFCLDAEQSRRKASRILDLMVNEDLTKIPTEPCCQHVWNKFLSEQ